MTIRERIDKFCKTYPSSGKTDRGVRDDTLTRTHWHPLNRLHDCLKVFEVSTLSTEGRRHFFYDWFPTLQFLLDHIHLFQEEFAEEVETDSTFSYLSDCCSHAWHKAEKYYTLCDETPMVYAAVVLNPTVKLGWFKARWTLPEQQDWLERIMVQVKDLWKSEYRPALPPPLTAVVKDDQDNLYIRLHNYKRVRLTSDSSLVDQLDDYLATDLVPESEDFDPIQYWFERRRSQPELARFAFDTLALPLMSDDPERSFSAGRDLLTYRKSNLRDDIIESCSCLRSWFGSPAVKKQGSTWIVDDFDDEAKIEEQYQKQTTKAAEDNDGTADSEGER